ncbi:MAG: hypothetical protein D6721_09740 [Gammaproteobacteria bacterium]|nr:MAG: hypothetical protein D6721_09740 [Gammaproteobacteria bacterium]
MSLLLEALKQAEREHRRRREGTGAPAGTLPEPETHPPDAPAEEETGSSCDFELLEPEATAEDGSDPASEAGAPSPGQAEPDAEGPGTEPVAGEAGEGRADPPEGTKIPPPDDNAPAPGPGAVDEGEAAAPPAPEILQEAFDMSPAESSDAPAEADDRPSHASAETDAPLAPTAVARLLELSVREEHRYRLFAALAGILVLAGTVALYALFAPRSLPEPGTPADPADPELALAEPDPGTEPLQTEAGSATGEEPDTEMQVADFSRLQPVHPPHAAARSTPTPEAAPPPATASTRSPARERSVTAGAPAGTAAAATTRSATPQRSPVPRDAPRVRVGVRTLHSGRGRDARARAYRLLRRGAASAARRLYQALLEDRPGDVELLLGLAAADLALGRETEAEALYRRVLDLDPGNPYAASGLSLLSRAPRAGARDPVLLGARAALQARRGDWAAAERLYFQAHALAPDDPVLTYGLAVSLDHLGRLAEALRYYREALAHGGQAIDTDAVRRRIARLRAQQEGAR